MLTTRFSNFDSSDGFSATASRQPATRTARSEPVIGGFALKPVDHTSAWSRLPNRCIFRRLAAPALDCWLVCALLADKLVSSINNTTG
jgi:hypothetical protein